MTRTIGNAITSTGESESDLFKPFANYMASFVDRDMLMRYHFGLGIGHIYSHTQPSCPSGSITESRNNDSEHLSNSLESGHADFESVTSSSDRSDPESDEEHEELDSESILGDYADMDGWDGTDSDAVMNEYEF